MNLVAKKIHQRLQPVKRSERTTAVKLAGKTHLARYGIDQFITKISSQAPPGSFLLDGGAGSCRYKNFVPHARYVGLDQSSKLHRVFGDIDVRGDLSDLPFRDNSFGATLSVEVLEHVKEPGLVLAELYRVLQPGGKLFLVAPQGWEEHGAPYDYFRFTSFGLRYLFERVGFEVLSIEPLGGYFWYLGHRIAKSYRYLFPAGRSRIRKFFDAPLRPPGRFLLRWAIPYLCFYLDRTDRKKSFTLNYGAVCRKPL